jgi:23S rRNA (uracil1939-C5)-methyltransferase
MKDQTNLVNCTHGDDCGACSLLGVDYEGQLRRKREILAQALAEHTGLRRIRPLPCLASPLRDSYRNRAKMAIGISNRSGTHLGYFRSGTREIVDAPDCRVLVPAILETTRQIRRWLETARNIPPALRHIDVRSGTDPKRQHLTLVFRATESPSFPLDSLRKRCPAVKGISVNLNPTTGPQVIRGAVRPLWGEREIWIDHAGVRLRVSPAAFFQVNLALLPTVHQLMEGFFERGDVLADLYAGVGTHGLALRHRFKRLLFAEGNRSAVADLKSTARTHSITDLRISPVSVERGLDRLRDEAPDAVVLNPSRAGARPEVLDAVSHCPVTKLAYLSCDPKTLCRDLDLLYRKGFTIRSVQPIDMMPQTRQVEALALLTRPSNRTDKDRSESRS